MSETTAKLNPTDAGSHAPKPGTDGQPINFLAIYNAEVKQRHGDAAVISTAATVSDTGPPTKRTEAQLESTTPNRTTEATTTVNPYKQLQVAETAANEVRALVGKKDTDVITYTDPSGKTEIATVGERRAALQKIIHQQGAEAIAAADSIIKTGSASPAAQRAAVEPTRQELATRTGYGPNAEIDMKDLIKRLDSPNLTPELRRDLEDLKTVQTKANEMMAMDHAQEITRLLNAKFRSEGLLDPADASGNLLPKQASIIEAFQLVREASRLGVDGALSTTADFQQLSQTINKQYGDFQSQTFKSITDDITLGDSLKATKPELALPILQGAAKKADGVDIAYLASLLPTQTDPEVRTQLIQMIQTAENARIDAATLLNKMGRHDEALPLLTRAQAEAGPLVAQDPTFFQEMNKALYSNAGSDSTQSAQAYAAKFSDLMQHKQFDEAAKELAKMKAFTAAQMQAEKDVPAITTEKKRVDDALAALGKDTADDQYSAAQRKILTDEQTGLANQLALANQAQFNYHYTDLLEGEWNRVMGNSDHNQVARNCYTKFAQEEPAFAKQIHLEQLQDAVADKGFFSSDGLKQLGCEFVATAVGIGTGVGAAALTVWGGPLAGVAGVAAGTAAGTATYAALEHFALGKEVTGRMLIEGAAYTLGGTAMFYTGGLTAIPEAGAETAGTSLITRAATALVPRLAPVAANAVIVNGTHMGTAMYYDHQDLKHASMDFATTTSLDLMLGFLPAPKIAKSFAAPATEAFVAGMREGFGKTTLSSAERTIPKVLTPTVRNLAPNVARSVYEYGVVRGPGGTAVIATGVGAARPYLQQVPQLRGVVGDPADEQAARVTQTPLGSDLPDAPDPNGGQH